MNFKSETPIPQISIENSIPTIDPETEKNIKEVFELSPELEKIGTQEQYFEYIKSIFPESKISDIVHHGSKQTPKSFNTNKEGIFFTDSLHYANMYGNELSKLAEGIVINKSLPVVLNIKNPYHPDISISTRPSHKDIYFNPINTPEGYDGVIGKDAYAETLGNSIVVFNPDQIHILGSESDMQKFKEFVSKG